MFPITYATETFMITVAICGFIQIILALNVVRHRHRTKICIGHGNDKPLEFAMRAFGNFTENTPISLIVIGAVTFLGAHVDTVFALCFFFLLSRVIHALSVLQFERSNTPTMNYRMASMGLQILVFAIGATVILLEILFNGFNPF